MYLRILVGPYCGQVLLFSPEAARSLLADGRAVVPMEMVDEPFCDPAPAPSVSASQPAAESDAAHGKKKKPAK